MTTYQYKLSWREASVTNSPAHLSIHLTNQQSIRSPVSTHLSDVHPFIWARKKACRMETGSGRKQRSVSYVTYCFFKGEKKWNMTVEATHRGGHPLVAWQMSPKRVYISEAGSFESVPSPGTHRERDTHTCDVRVQTTEQEVLNYQRRGIWDGFKMQLKQQDLS